MQLHRMGINRVRPLRGGFDGWKVAGFPLIDYVDDAAPTEETPLVQIAMTEPETRINQPA